jgi:hypothetical protein
LKLNGLGGRFRLYLNDAYFTSILANDQLLAHVKIDCACLPFSFVFSSFISGHYKWALSQLFEEWKFNRVIILEGA